MKTHTVEVPDVVVRVLPHVMRLLLYMAGTVAGAYLALVIHQTVPSPSVHEMVPPAGASGAIEEKCGAPPLKPCPDASAEETSRETYEDERTTPTPTPTPTPTASPTPAPTPEPTPTPTPEPTQPPDRNTAESITDHHLTAYFPSGRIAFEQTTEQETVTESGAPAMAPPQPTPNYEAIKIALNAAADCDPIAMPSVCKGLARVARDIATNLLPTGGGLPRVVPASASPPRPAATRAPSTSPAVAAGDFQSWMTDCGSYEPCRTRWNQHLPVLSEAAEANGVPLFLLLGVAYKESTFRPTLVSDEGGGCRSHGMFQLNDCFHLGIAARIADIPWMADYTARLLKGLGDEAWVLAGQPSEKPWCRAIDAYQGRDRDDPVNYAAEIWTCQEPGAAS